MVNFSAPGREVIPPGPHNALSQTSCPLESPSCGGCSSIWFLLGSTRPEPSDCSCSCQLRPRR
uniref:Uncharacterized protein n=1 Tax=Anguilla anguilla TaxID=7936 RepID=A0A0E9TS27_ANGAN